jgi:hypothetical protein
VDKELEESLLKAIKAAKRYARNTLAAPETPNRVPQDALVNAFRQVPRAWAKWQQALPTIQQAQQAHQDYLQHSNQATTSLLPASTLPYPSPATATTAQQSQIAHGVSQSSHALQSSQAPLQSSQTPSPSTTPLPAPHVAHNRHKSRFTPYERLPAQPVPSDRAGSEPRPEQQNEMQPSVHFQQHASQLPLQAPRSTGPERRPKRLKVAERTRRGELEPVRRLRQLDQPFTPGLYDVHPDLRPGGQLPFPKVDFKHSLRDCPDYPSRSEDPSKVNNLLARASLLRLAQDECQKICYGVYFVTQGNRKHMTCPYILYPGRCRNSHSLQQGVIDFVVTQRGVAHATIQKMMSSIVISGATGHVPPIQIPNASSHIAPTPAELDVQTPPIDPTQLESNTPGRSTSVTSNLHGRSAPKAPVTDGPWASGRTVQDRIRAEDAERTRLTRENPVSHHAYLTETYRPSSGHQSTTSTYHSRPRSNIQPGTSATPVRLSGANQFTTAQDSHDQEVASGPSKENSKFAETPHNPITRGSHKGAKFENNDD